MIWDAVLHILQDASIFEAVHGSAPDIAGIQLDSFVELCYSSLNSAGKGLANPTALLLSSLMMLRSVHVVFIFRN